MKNGIIKEKGVMPLHTEIAELEYKKIHLELSIEQLEKELEKDHYPKNTMLINKQIKQERALKETIQKRIEVITNAEVY